MPDIDHQAHVQVAIVVWLKRQDANQYVVWTAAAGEVWLAKSMVKLSTDDSGMVTVFLPRGLARQKGLMK
jgi:hypothetical protein